jgi:hypothetical protein
MALLVVRFADNSMIYIGFVDVLESDGQFVRGDYLGKRPKNLTTDRFL